MLGLDASPPIQPILDTAESEPLSTLPMTRVPKPRLLREFSTAFVTIFLAEIGDKTQLATLLMTAESRSPWVVFAGAAAALLTTSLLGVIIGRWLARRFSDQVLQTATGAGMLLIAVLLLWDIVHLG
ncbi:MAG: TMEM165/GDT1 family protein [Thermosynechococcaceae cyanobacterium]